MRSRRGRRARAGSRAHSAVLEREPTSAAVPIPTSATITIRYAHQPRVVRTLSSSERTSAVTGGLPAGQLEEDLLERRALDRELVQDDSVSRGQLADPLRREVDRQHAAVRGRDRRALRGEQVAKRGRVGRAHPRRAAGAGDHLGDRRLLHQLAAVDDHDLVDGLGDSART